MANLEIHQVTREYLQEKIKKVRRDYPTTSWGSGELYNAVRDEIARELGIPLKGVGEPFNGKYHGHRPEENNELTKGLDVILRNNNDLFGF